jgi:hypothetical protein
MTSGKFSLGCQLGCQVSKLAAKFKLGSQVSKLKNLAKETNTIGHVLNHVIYTKFKKNKKEQKSKELCLALDVSVHSLPLAKHNSQLLYHMPLLSNLTTKQWGKVDKANFHKIVICTGVPQDTVKAAIGKHNCRR